MLRSIDKFSRERVRVGDVVTVRTQPLGIGYRYERFIIESFPAAREFRHCAIVSRLRDRQRFLVAQHCLHVDEIADSGRRGRRCSASPCHPCCDCHTVYRDDETGRFIARPFRRCCRCGREIAISFALDSKGGQR